MSERAILRPEAADIFRRLDALDLNQRQLADALGIDENKISKVRGGIRQFKGPELLASIEWLNEQELAQACGVESDHTPTRSMGVDETVHITRLDLSLSMGPGTIIDEWVESEPVTFDLAFIRQITRSPPGQLRLVTGIGRSMEPTLQDGDTVMIDTMDKQLARQDGIYWISIYGAAGIKRLRAIGQDAVMIISDNKDVAPQEVAKSDLRIEGRAIWAARGL